MLTTVRTARRLRTEVVVRGTALARKHRRAWGRWCESRTRRTVISCVKHHKPQNRVPSNPSSFLHHSRMNSCNYEHPFLQQVPNCLHGFLSFNRLLVQNTFTKIKIEAWRETTHPWIQTLRWTKIVWVSPCAEDINIKHILRTINSAYIYIHTHRSTSLSLSDYIFKHRHILSNIWLSFWYTGHINISLSQTFNVSG